MKVFLIVLAVLFLITVLILSISADVTLIFDDGWTTKVKVLFIEKDVKMSELLSFILLPDKAGAEAAEKKKKPKEEKQSEEPEITVEAKETVEEKPEIKEEKPAKPNYIKKILEEDGVVGIMLLVSNLLQTANSAVTTLIKGLHIYSLYVKMIIGGGDVADIGEKYGAICGWYYPLKGVILNQMKVDEYDDLIQADFIAPRSEYEFQLIASISIGLLLKVLLKAGKVFLVNFIKNK